MTINQPALDALVAKLFCDLSAGYGGVMVSIGDKLGLYKAMAAAGPLSSEEAARRSSCAKRYVREWLNSQVAGGYVMYHPGSETYELSAEQAQVLARTQARFSCPTPGRSSLLCGPMKTRFSTPSAPARASAGATMMSERQPCQTLASGT